MIGIDIVLLLLAFICFIVAAIPSVSARINFLAIGLALWVLVSILETLKVGA